MDRLSQPWVSVPLRVVFSLVLSSSHWHAYVVSAAVIARRANSSKSTVTLTSLQDRFQAQRLAHHLAIAYQQHDQQSNDPTFTKFNDHTTHSLQAPQVHKEVDTTPLYLTLPQHQEYNSPCHIQR
jgi:hypothetical protein